MNCEMVKNVVKFVFLFLICFIMNQTNVFAAEVGVTAQNFPDDTFRSYVIQEIDKDKNGVLSEAEISSVTKIVTTGSTRGEEYIATNFQGIGFFTELEDLQIEAVLLKDPKDQYFGDQLLDVRLDLSSNIKLKRLVCRAATVEKLDLSILPLLEEIRLDTAMYQKQDLSKHVHLKKIFLEHGTQFILPEHMPLLEEFGLHWDDLSEKEKPPEIDFRAFPNLSKLELQGGDYSNRILDFKNLANLKTLVFRPVSFMSNNNSITVDLGGCSGLEKVEVQNVNKINFQGCENIRELSLSNKLPELNMSGLVNLEVLSCYYLDGTLLDIQNNRKLKNVDIVGGKFTKILFPKGINIHKFSLTWNNQLTELDLRGTQIDNVCCDRNALEKILFSKKAKYKKVTVKNNRLAKLDLRGIKVDRLCADGNWINTVLLSKSGKYKELSVKNNRLTKLDLRGIKINYLCADKNLIQKVLLSKSGRYDEILLAYNYMTKLDLRGIRVKVVDVKFNDLRSLKVRGNKELCALYCQKNKLRTLDTRKCKKLKTLVTWGNKKLKKKR